MPVQLVYFCGGMIAYLEGKLTLISPTAVCLNVQGVGYELHISLTTYEKVVGKTDYLLHTWHTMDLRTGTTTMYGFATVEEKQLFLQLISVSGVGPAAARAMLSSASVYDISSAIVSGDAAMLTRFKGIGAKTAQRLVVELKDVLGRQMGGALTLGTNNNIGRDEALQALLVLGYSRIQAEKTLNAMLANNPAANVEQLIKLSLKAM